MSADKQNKNRIMNKNIYALRLKLCFRLISLRFSIIGRVPNSPFIIGVDAVLLISTSYFLHNEKNNPLLSVMYYHSFLLRFFVYLLCYHLNSVLQT